MIRQALAPASISHTALQALLQRARLHHFEAGALLLRRNEPCSGLWLLLQGQVSVGDYGRDGRWRQTRAPIVGEWIEVASAWLHGLHLESALARSAGLALELPLAALDEVGQQHPLLYRALLSCVARQLGQTLGDLRAQQTQDIASRLADWLLHAQPEGMGGTPQVMLAQPKGALASQLGVTPETLSRTLKALRGAGLIEVDHQCIRLQDLPGLQRLAQSGLLSAQTCRV